LVPAKTATAAHRARPGPTGCYESEVTMKKLIITVAGITAFSLTACGTTAGLNQMMVAPAPPGVTISAPSGNMIGPVGTSFLSTYPQNNKMYVTLTHVIDPAPGLHMTPGKGKRFVGAAFELVGVSGAYYDDDTYSDVVVFGSDGRIYKSNSSSITGCTIGSFQVTRGQRLFGCVVFQVPNRVQVKSIRWSMFGTNATWSLKVR
jgi:hypothetical protein